MWCRSVRVRGLAAVFYRRRLHPAPLVLWRWPRLSGRIRRNWGALWWWVHCANCSKSNIILSKRSSVCLLHRAVSIWSSVLKYFDWRKVIAFTARYFFCFTTSCHFSFDDVCSDHASSICIEPHSHGHQGMKSQFTRHYWGITEYGGVNKPITINLLIKSFATHSHCHSCLYLSTSRVN